MARRRRSRCNPGLADALSGTPRLIRRTFPGSRSSSRMMIWQDVRKYVALFGRIESVRRAGAHPDRKLDHNLLSEKEGIQMKATIRTFTALLAMLVGVATAWGQLYSGSVTGLVLDSSGAVIPGARVPLADEDKGTVLNSVTDASG